MANYRQGRCKGFWRPLQGMCADFINTQWNDESELAVGETKRGVAEATQEGYTAFMRRMRCRQI